MGKAEAWARAHKGLLGLLAAVAAGLGVLLFLMHPKGQQAAQSALSALPGVGPSTGNQSGTSTTSTTPQGFWATIRGAGAVPGYDAAHSGVPLWSGPWGAGTSPNLLQYVPWGSQLQILDTTSAGAPVGMPGGPTQWYKVAWGGITGWVSSFDLASFLGQVPSGFGQPPAAPFPSPFGPAAGPFVPLKTQLNNVPASSAVMSGVG